MTIDPKLLEWATDREKEFAQAIDKYGSGRAAENSLHLSRDLIGRAMRSLAARAARSGYSPQHDMVRAVPEGFGVRGTSTYYNAEGKVTGQWVKSQIDSAQQEKLLKEFAATLAEGVRGLAPASPAPGLSNADLLCVYPMGDPHFGMHSWWQETGDDFDLKKAEDLTCAAIDRLIAAAPDAETAVLLNLGDMFHADDQSNLSKSGHQLDVDGRWTKVQQVGLRAMIYCLDKLLKKHKSVVFRINKGNHDGHSSYALSLMVSCYYHNEPRLSVDLSPAVAWYYQFGKVLIASTHGDTMKGKDLPSVMADDCPEMWGLTKHRHWYVGHVHHMDFKEYRGCTVEYFRTLAARDAWHAGQGYRAGRDMRLIVLHREHGEIERHRCDIGMLGEGK